MEESSMYVLCSGNKQGFVNLIYPLNYCDLFVHYSIRIAVGLQKPGFYVDVGGGQKSGFYVSVGDGAER